MEEPTWPPTRLDLEMHVSILLGTYRRAELLSQTLAAMSRLSTADLAWELIVVDNATEAATRKVCQSFSDRLPLRYVVCTRPGQNAARNRGLKEVSGELVLLADDDMSPEESWLREMYQGAQRWPEQVLFGGRILPRWPGRAPDFEIEPGIGRWSYGICDPDLPEGPDPTFLPISMNMAVRRSVFDSGMAFDETIGPRGRNYAMGSETEFNFRLRRRGYAAVFLPRSVVHSIIRPEQLSREWVLGRAFRQGRGESRLQAPISWYAVARLSKQALWIATTYFWERLSKGQTDPFRRRLACALARGRLYEAWRLKFGLR
jgi:glycosyltransferase involved in cell wall biosynthesis